MPVPKPQDNPGGRLAASKAGLGTVVERDRLKGTPTEAEANRVDSTVGGADL